MPQSEYNALQNHESTGLSLTQLSNACPNPLTPPPELQDLYAPVQLQYEHSLRMSGGPSPNNTAAGMAQSQEDSIYMSPAASPEAAQHGFFIEDKDKMDISHEDCRDGTKTPGAMSAYEATHVETNTSVPAVSTIPVSVLCATDAIQQVSNTASSGYEGRNSKARTHSKVIGNGAVQHETLGVQDEAMSKGLASIDLYFNRATTTQPWTFSETRLLPTSPSHVFQSMSRYSGTQQSDRQVYNVDVTVLTVDVAQCAMTGYLLIRGLTPEHDTLQTYFTGEIIGGPSRSANEKQKYTFRTSNVAWGASEKTDLMHWARFPAWRQFHTHAKRNIDFSHPVDGGNWWQQENIFMRWKEHFLVPDHKTKSIAGASFEGFYYICLNQIRGRISGIYYHSKSEKFQQLELEHEGHTDIFNRGVSPCIEFR